MDKATITSGDVKLINKNRIYKYVYNKGQTSRQEIFEEIGLSMPTIYQNLNTLLDEGYVSIDGSFNSTGGRKAQIFSINRKAALAVALNITDSRMYARVVDLYGNITAEERLDIKFGTDNKYAKEAAALVDKCIKKAETGSGKILGVGITVPGILNDDGTMIIDAPTMGVKNCSIKELAQYIPYPWICMNDAKSGSYAEYWFNVRNTDGGDYLYLMLGQGVGGAYCSISEVYGELYGTSLRHNKSGEFGHMTIHPDGKKCFCGKKGCFESYVSERCLSDNLGISLDDFFHRLESGDTDADKVFDEYLDNLAIGINNLYTIYDCRVIVGGSVAEYLKIYSDLIRKKLSMRYSFGTDGSYLSFAACSDAKAQSGAALTYIAKYIDTI